MTQVLIYVHGTNGSGKSTLARAVAVAAGGFKEFDPLPRALGKGGVTGSTRGVEFLGKYSSPTGGVDGFSPYALVHDAMTLCAALPKARMFAEGLITPGVETCQKFASYVDGNAHFIVLCTPVEQCIEQVLKRRTRKGNAKLYDPANLHKKHASALHWGDRLERNGLTVHRLKYPEAYRLSLELLGLPMPGLKELL